MAFYLAEIAMIFILWPVSKISFVINRWKFLGKNLYLFLVFLMFFLTMALRATSVGTDTLVYRGIYEVIMRATHYKEALMNSSISSAPVYVGIQFIISRLSGFKQLSIIVNSMIICGGFYCFIHNNSKHYCLSSFLFVALSLFFESMNGSRQFMAIAIAINAYILIKNNPKTKIGWGLFLLAIGIHNTIVGFLLFLFPIILKKRIHSFKDCVLYSVIVSFGVYVFFFALLQVAVHLFPYFDIYINGTNGSQITSELGNGRITFLYLAIGMIMIVTHFFIQRNRATLNIDYTDEFCSILCVFLGILFSKNILFIRILWPLMCIMLISLPNLLLHLKKYDRMIMVTFLAVVFFAYGFIFLMEDKSSIVPYALFWQ